MMEQKAGSANPVITELGKQVLPMTQIPVNSLLKRTIESFQAELVDETMANLHFVHHTKRRIKNLLRLNETIA